MLITNHLRKQNEIDNANTLSPSLRFRDHKLALLICHTPKQRRFL